MLKAELLLIIVSILLLFLILVAIKKINHKLKVKKIVKNYIQTKGANTYKDVKNDITYPKREMRNLHNINPRHKTSSISSYKRTVNGSFDSQRRFSGNDNSKVQNRIRSDKVKDLSNICGYCKKHARGLTYYSKENGVLGVCTQCKPQAERQALVKI